MSEPISPKQVNRYEVEEWIENYLDHRMDVEEFDWEGGTLRVNFYQEDDSYNNDTPYPRMMLTQTCYFTRPAALRLKKFLEEFLRGEYKYD